MLKESTTLHPHVAGRVYAAYGGVYITVALMWLWAVDAVRPSVTDWVGEAQEDSPRSAQRWLAVRALL